MRRLRGLVGASVLIAGVAIGFLFAAPAGEGDDDLESYRDPERLLELINDPPDNFYLVDVRTTEEYVAGHIPGALHHDYREIAENLPTENRDAFIILYCRTGRRSNIALETLTDLGFTRVLDWGGIIDWPYEVVTGPDPQ